MENSHLYVSKKSEKAVSAVIAKALASARKQFGYFKPLGIVVFESWDFYGTKGDSHAYSYKDEAMIITVNFQRKDWKSWLRSTIFHELTHVIRWNEGVFGDRLADALVLEGVAGFVEEKVSKEQPYIIEPIKGEDKFARQAQKQFHLRNFDYDEWFNGTKKIPNMFGYRYGYLLVKEFWEAKNIPTSDLMRMSADEIIQGIGS